MANFICPFSNKVCKPSCEYWEFLPSKNKSTGIIPLNFSMNDILGQANNIMYNTNIPFIFKLLLREYQKYYELYNPEKTSLPIGKCKKIENFQEKDTEID